MLDASAERWLPIADYEGFYEVSSQGRIRSLDRMSTMRDGRVRRHTGRTLKLKLNPQTGYLMCSLSRDGEVRTRAVHRLVAETFLGVPSAGLEVCHNDGNPINNAPTNLRWDTRTNNHRDKRRHGTAGNAYQTNKTHCVNGHEFTPDNTGVGRKGGYTYRVCRACKIAWKQRLKEQHEGDTPCFRPSDTSHLSSGLSFSSSDTSLNHALSAQAGDA